MNELLVDVALFQRKMLHAYEGPPRVPGRDLTMFRLRFLAEELREISEELGATFDYKLHDRHGTSGAFYREDHPIDLAKVLRELVDLDYVHKGTVLQLGLENVYGEAWRRVHAANMEKEPGVEHRRGFARDVVKPPGWKAPALRDLVR